MGIEQRLESLLQEQHVSYELLTAEPTVGKSVGEAVGEAVRAAVVQPPSSSPSPSQPRPALRGASAGGAKARISARDMAKIVIVALDGRLAMVVLPATESLDLERLKAASGSREVRVTSDDDYRSAFPDCEAGAMPPFGNLYDMPVYVAETLREDQQIVFAAGTYRRLMRMSYRDFARLVQPTVAPLSDMEA